jgi:hypothetical protein
LKVGGDAAKNTSVERTGQIRTAESVRKEKYFAVFVAGVLLAFGVYHSILYFGHQVVPNPDFTAFNRVGHELWSFKLPSTYKQAPVLGLLQVPLGYLVGGRHPDLTASWLLNALLHPFNLILLWQVGRKIVGKSALWLAVVVILNPWIINMLTESLVETTLLFFILLTFYFIFKHSRWCYLFASITTMVRYEGAALILAAFVMDMIKHKNKKERIYVFVYSTLACVPFGFWLLGTILHLDTASGNTYFGFFSITFKNTTNVLNTLWMVTFNSLFTFPFDDKDSLAVLMYLSKILAAGSFAFGIFYGLLKRRWNILALLIFFVPYMLVHIFYFFSISRFYTPVCWIVLWISWFGLQSIWFLINKNNRFPKYVIFIAQGILLAITLVWLSRLVGSLPKLTPISRASASVPYVAVGVVALLSFTKPKTYGALL